MFDQNRLNGLRCGGQNLLFPIGSN